MIFDSYPLQIFFFCKGYDLFAYSCQMCANLTYFQRKALKQLWPRIWLVHFFLKSKLCMVFKEQSWRGSWSVEYQVNRLISFSNFSQIIRRLCSLLLLNVYKPGPLAKKSIEAIAPESPRERYIYSVPVWLPSVYILPRWIQSMIIYLGMNVLTIGELVFSGIDNTKCKK